MNYHRLKYCILVLLLLFPSMSWSETYIDAEIFKSYLICVSEEGQVFAWSIDNRKREPAFSEVLSSRNISYIASNSMTLWAISDRKLLKLSDNLKQWEELETIDSDENIVALLSLGDEPIVVFPQNVVRPATNQVFNVPDLGGQLSIDYLRVLTDHVAVPNIYFGTGQGEWGGHLVKLNTDTGNWTYYYDALHYATGITQDNSDELIVSWSMSHFIANTLIRRHNQDLSVKEEFPELDSKYYQSIIYNTYNNKLFGIEQNNVVEINNGVPSIVSNMGDLPYSREPDAIGVAPGILTLIPQLDGSLIIVHKGAIPMVLINQRLLLFEQ